ncbi:MAG: hypothetical protein EBU54_17175 [Mycobacteriaceae bacterium]|nr:hypothetical protein [Mycobacteriaceae bacterium]
MGSKGKLGSARLSGSSGYADYASQYRRGLRFDEAEYDADLAGDLAGDADVAGEPSVADTCESIHLLIKAQAGTLQAVAAQVAKLSAEVAELAALLRQMTRQ